MTSDKNTVRLHRVLRAPVERVYKAFIDADALCRWIPPYGFIGKIHEIEIKVGGGYRMSFTNFGTGHSHTFSCKFVELIPNEQIRYTDVFDDPNLPGEMQVVVNFRSVLCGTELSVHAYLTCESRCPACAAAFNPGCHTHRHLYFAEG